MSGYCPDCGNTQCICKEVEAQKNAPSSCTVDSIVGLKARVSEILHEALRGYDQSTRYRTEAGYVRWGLVERDIHAAIDEANSVIHGKRCHHIDVFGNLNGERKAVRNEQRRAIR